MKHIYRYTPEFVLVCYILIFAFFKHPANNWERVINSDGKGYYAYLPALFIYHDLDYKFIESYEDKYYPADRLVFKEFRVNTGSGIVNKCFPGLAILWLPFFLLAHFLSYLAGFDPDGYSILYQYSIAFASLFYLWLGCKFLFRFLVEILPDGRNAAIATFVTGLGTNLIYYTIIEGSMTHVYSFALITLFLYCLLRFFVYGSRSHFVLSAILFSLIVLVRPVNGLVILLVPMIRALADSISRKHFVARPYLASVLTALLSMVILFAIPVVLWHIQTGRWIVYSYGDEHFNFSDPHFFSILFSYNRGWFVYTPAAFVALAGFPGLYKRSRQASLWLAVFLVVFIFITSSWWMWFYASKCGQRIFIDILCLPALLLFFLLLSLEKKRAQNVEDPKTSPDPFIRTGQREISLEDPIPSPLPSKGRGRGRGHASLKQMVTLLLLLLVGLNLVQFYQHSRWIFPSIDIDRKIYWSAFFSFHPVSRVNIPEETVLSEKSYSNDLESNHGWMNEGTLTTSLSYSGGRSCMITRSNPYSVGLVAGLDSILQTGNNVVRIRAIVLSLGSRSGASLVADFGADGKSLYYKAFYLEPFARPDKWTKIESAFYIPRDLPEKPYAKIYFFLPDGSVPLLIDDLEISFLKLKDEQKYSRLEGVLSPSK